MKQDREKLRTLGSFGNVLLRLKLAQRFFHDSGTLISSKSIAHHD